jgi:hypothetical protein
LRRAGDAGGGLTDDLEEPRQREIQHAILIQSAAAPQPAGRFAGDVLPPILTAPTVTGRGHAREFMHYSLLLRQVGTRGKSVWPPQL